MKLDRKLLDEDIIRKLESYVKRLSDTNNNYNETLNSILYESAELSAKCQQYEDYFIEKQIKFDRMLIDIEKEQASIKKETINTQYVNHVDNACKHLFGEVVE